METQQKCKNPDIIEVPTPLGVLCAESGGEPEDYPEIYVYLRLENGTEIDLACICAQQSRFPDKVRALLWDDMSTDELVERRVWTKEEIGTHCQKG